MLESKFQSKLIDELYSLFPGCIVIKNDPNYLQGFPDLSIFWEKKWAWLECKKSATEAHQPNQDWYVDLGKEMSFAAFIYPENKEAVLHELQLAFRSRR